MDLGNYSTLDFEYMERKLSVYVELVNNKVASRCVPDAYRLLFLTDSDPRTGGQFNYGFGQV